MNIKQKIKVECIKKNISVKCLSKELNMNSSQLLYHYINKQNITVISRIENILKLPKGFFLQE